MPMTREEFAFNLKQKFPAYRDLDNNELVDRVVQKHPVYRDQIVDFEGSPGNARITTSTEEPGFDPGRAAADALRGAGAGMKKTFANLGELGTRIFSAARMDTPARREKALAPFSAFKEDVEAETPDTTAAKVGEGAETVGEFMLGGEAKVGAQALAKLSPLARRVLTEALTQGTVGSLREGKLADPSAFATGAAGGALGHGMGKMAERLSNRAVRTFARIIGPGQEQGREKALVAIERGLKEKTIPRGAGISTLSAAARKQADEAHQALNTFREGASKQINLQDAVKRVRDEAKNYVATGTNIPTNRPAFEKLNQMADELESLGQSGARTAFIAPEKGPAGFAVDPAALEDFLTQFSVSFEKASEPAVASTQEAIRKGGNALRRGLNEAQPGRGPLGTAISEETQLAERLSDVASKEPFQPGGSAGAILALSGTTAAGGAALGGLVGGSKEDALRGGALGATVPFVVLRLFRSPYWRSLSASEQMRLAQSLKEMPQAQAGRLMSALAQLGQEENR